MDKFKNFTIFGLTILCIILLFITQCGGPNTVHTNNITDTLVVTKIDTVDRPYEVIKFKTQYYPKWDTFKVTDSALIDKQYCDITRFYSDSLTDSNLTIFSEEEVIGIIKEKNLSYRLKVPLKIVERHEFHVTDYKPSKFQFLINTEVGGSLTKFNLGIGADLLYKRAQVGYKYGIVDQTHNIKIGYRLFSSKK